MTSTEVALNGAASNENFMKTAFSMQMDEISSPMVLNNYVVMLKLTGEEIIATDEDAALFDSYVSQFDQVSVQNAVMTSDKLQNDFFTVFFQYFMNFE